MSVEFTAVDLTRSFILHLYLLSAKRCTSLFCIPSQHIAFGLSVANFWSVIYVHFSVFELICFVLIRTHIV